MNSLMREIYCQQSVSMGLYDGRNCGYDERGRKYCLIKLLFMRLE